MDRRKELKEQYKMMKPDMGVFIVKSKHDNRCFLEATSDLKSTINSTRFKLNFGNHPNKELQKEWKEYGENAFTIEILEKLEYDKDESKTDYSEELAILKMEWEDKLSNEGMDFY